MNFLPHALNVAGILPVESTRALAADVSATSTIQTARVREVPELASQINVSLTPIALLQSLGRATSSLPALGAPGAAGLPGLSALKIASGWAIIRYLWAFTDPDPRLRFSAIATQLRRHERGLFSEQIAIGVATHLVENHLLDPAANASTIDIDAVFAHSVLGQLVAPIAAHRPDYLVHTSPLTGRPEMVVLEVKGNSSGRPQGSYSARVRGHG